jgi:divalent metal cation (Fe/Co/Zn/Cd) transporter
MMADSKRTDICVYLPAILFGGLFLNAVFGWRWADPIVAMVMLPYTKEGFDAMRGKTYCDSGGYH